MSEPEFIEPRRDAHRDVRKLLVVVDDTPECALALIYAGKRAQKTGASVVALCIATTAESQHWLGVDALMREEAEQEAEEMLDRALARVADKLPHEPERKVAVGQRVDGIRQAILDDPAIMTLVLAASAGSEGPGPLISAIAGGQSGLYPIPITIVPGSLSEEEIEAIV